MKVTPALLFLVFACKAHTLGSEQINQLKVRPSTANWPLHRLRPASAITTNTPEFDAWALAFMLSKANEMREKWNLDIPRPLSPSDVYFVAVPTRDGLEGDLLSRDQRFHWQFARNACIAFYDTRYFAPSFRYQDDKASALAKIPSKINKKEATAIARDALHKLLGMTEKKLGYKTPPEVNQYKYQDTNGRVYPLPLFDVRWRKKGPKEYAAANLESFALYMEVSGVTCGVVKYHHPELLNKDAPIPRDPLPTNYFQMLGLPESYPDSVPERQSRLRGFTSSTNAASPITNTTR